MKILWIIAVFLLACESSSLDGFREIPESEIEIGKGSDAFASGNYSDAISHFEEALRQAKTNEDKSNASMGLGFAHMRMSQSSQNAAYTFFNQALSFNPNNNDAKCGKMFLEFSFQNNLNEAITLAEEIIASNDNYKMKFDAKVDRSDVLITIALAQFYTENYLASLNAVKRMTGLSAYSVDLSTASGIQSLSHKISELIELHKQ